MLAYTLKKTLNLIPEAQPLVKEASIEESFPIDSEASCLASALSLNYMEKVAQTSVDLDVRDKVHLAVQAYELQDKVDDLTGKMVKAAQAEVLRKDAQSQSTYLSKEAYFAGSLTGQVRMDDVTKQAIGLYKEAQAQGWEPSPEVTIYSGHGVLNKEASVKALINRFSNTKNPTFVKLARAVFDIEEKTAKPETMVDLGLTVYNLDKEAGIRGDFFTESFMAKEAQLAGVMNVRLCGMNIPYEKLQANRSRLAAFVGDDLVKEMDNGPLHFKQTVEALPRDMQKQICDVVGNT